MRLATLSALLSVVSNAYAQEELQPVSALLAKADRLLAVGKSADALTLFSEAIERGERDNYLTFFKRATAYLSVHRHAQALADLTAALELKPDFAAARTQRAKTYAATAQWDEALRDSTGLTVVEIKAARKAQQAAEAAEAKNDSHKCVHEATQAINVASSSHTLRLLRARCQLRLGFADEAIGDLIQATKLQPTDRQAQVLAAATFFYALDDPERATQTIKTCLHYDPDDKLCKRTFRTHRRLAKLVAKVQAGVDGRTFSGAKRALRGHGDGEDREEGVLELVYAERDNLIADNVFSRTSHLALLHRLDVYACETFAETKDSGAKEYCDRALTTDPDAVGALRGRGVLLMREELWEEAVSTLSQANDKAGGGDRRVQELLQKAQRLLKQSKQKDYYKILGVPRDADAKQIKKQYRQLTKLYHPDKYRGNDMTPDQVARKIESINEAYEVLTDPELKARFDNGDDPNAPPNQNPFANHGFAQGSPFGGAGGAQFFQQAFGGGFPGGGFQGGGGGQHFKFHFQQ
ncbi:hypothetical protein PYCC9005_003349 [Savitreella phatthalungensis]